MHPHHSTYSVFECLWYPMTLWLRVQSKIRPRDKRMFKICGLPMRDLFWHQTINSDRSLIFWDWNLLVAACCCRSLYCHTVTSILIYTPISTTGYVLHMSYWLRQKHKPNMGKPVWLWLRWYFNFKIKCQEFDAGFVQPLEAVLTGTPLRTCYFCWMQERQEGQRPFYDPC